MFRIIFGNAEFSHVSPKRSFRRFTGKAVALLRETRSLSVLRASEASSSSSIDEKRPIPSIRSDFYGKPGSLYEHSLVSFRALRTSLIFQTNRQISKGQHTSLRRLLRPAIFIAEPPSDQIDTILPREFFYFSTILHSILNFTKKQTYVLFLENFTLFPDPRYPWFFFLHFEATSLSLSISLSFSLSPVFD